MTASLFTQLERLTRGRVCFVGLGNEDLGDDGVGIRLAEALLACGAARPVILDNDSEPADTAGPAWESFIAGSEPEKFIGRLGARDFDSLIFLDALDAGLAPGSLTVLDATQVRSRCPQISTHKIALGTIAVWVEANSRTKVWLLGVQPESLDANRILSATVQASLSALVDILAGLAPRVPA